MSNLWVTTPAWYDANQKAAEGFNVMWQEGVNAWYANKETIVKAYPDLFTTKNQAEVDWFLKYMEKHDQCVTSVYMDEAWIKEESALLPFLKAQGKIKEDVPDSKFIAMASPASAPPEAQPPTAAATPAASPSANGAFGCRQELPGGRRAELVKAGDPGRSRRHGARGPFGEGRSTR